MEEKINNPVEKEEKLEEKNLKNEIHLENFNSPDSREKEKESTEALENELFLSDTELRNIPVSNKKTQIVYKMITLFIFLGVTILAYSFEISVGVACFGLEGLEGLALIILLPILMIVPAAAAILYVIPAIMSIVGFGLSFKKTRKGQKRGGKIFFSILFALCIVFEAVLALLTVLFFFLIQNAY